MTVTRSAWILTLLAALVALAAGLWLWRAEGSPPTVSGPDEIVLGREARDVSFEIRDEGAGLRLARVVLTHAEGEAELAARAFPGSLLGGGGPDSARIEVRLDAEAQGLEEGSAQLRVEALDWSWRRALAGNLVERAIPVEIDLTAPRVQVRSGLTYVRRGGAALAVYQLSEPAVRDGVRVGERFYAGVPLPREGCPTLPAPAGGGAAASACRAAVFAVAVDAPADPAIRVVAEDRAGNATRVRWATRVQERRIPRVPISLGEHFLETKVADLAAAWDDIEAVGGVEAFVEINEERRARDEARIRELVARATPPRRWRGPFEQLANSQVTSVFAERRLYRYGGRVVSEATHYGYDLASTAGARVTAAAAGRVIFTGSLGIYGNAVLLDHGMGIVSLYGHLSSIGVAEGEDVPQGGALGRSGETGLAGGDHLHFAILVGDTYVDPREWWDPKWVREHIEVRLGSGAGPATPPASATSRP